MVDDVTDVHCGFVIWGGGVRIGGGSSSGDGGGAVAVVAPVALTRGAGVNRGRI